MADTQSARRYAKPIVLPLRLDLLHGPISGIVDLPRRLDWSGNARYDLDRPGRIVDLYRTVISDATDPADLHAYLDGPTLRQLWPTIWLGPEIRCAWESRFPELAALRGKAAAA